MAYVDTFDKDFNKLTTDAQAFNAIQKQQAADVAAYHAAYEKIEHTGNALEAFMMLFYLLAKQGSDQMNDTLAGYGAGLKIQGDLTKLGNDLEDQTNQNSSDVQLLKDHVTDLDKLLDTLSPNTLGSNPAAPQNLDVQAALGTTATGSMYQQFLTMRQDIYWAGDAHSNDDPNQAYNPTPVTAPATGPRTYHFDVDGNGYIQTYAQLHTDMAAQGDPDQANEAYKKNNDAFNMNTSTTQSTNAASNELITEQKNVTTAVQSFMVDMMHADSDVISATLKAPK
jgi:hypothetical protein